MGLRCDTVSEWECLDMQLARRRRKRKDDGDIMELSTVVLEVSAN